MTLPAASSNRLSRWLGALVLLLFAGSPGAGGAERVDVVILTFQPELLALLDKQLDPGQAPVDAGDNLQWIAGTIATERYRNPYRVVVGLAARPGDDSARAAVSAALARWRPRFLLGAGTAPALGGQLRAGDIMVSRLVWRYEYKNGALSCKQSDSFRTSGAIVTAVNALKTGKPGSDWGEVKAGAVASGNTADAHDRELVAAILQHNPRTLFSDEESAAIAMAVAKARDRGNVTGFAAIAANESRSDRRRAAVAVSRFIGTLIRERWPAAPVTAGYR